MKKISAMTNSEASAAIAVVVLDLAPKGVRAAAVLNEVIARGLSERVYDHGRSFCCGSKSLGGVSTYRLIDRTLQRLRKQGAIKFSNGEWVAA
jgi:hypothetical protein